MKKKCPIVDRHAYTIIKVQKQKVSFSKFLLIHRRTKRSY